jgi:hypothetical protein
METFEPYRSYKVLITEAELMAMGPSQVAALLRRRVTPPWDLPDTFEMDASAEKSLLQRDDALINISLARYARDLASVKFLFQSAEAASPLRLAVLSNASVTDDEILTKGFPVNLLGRDKDAAAWLETASDQELAALFENPSLGNEFLSSVLESKHPYGSLAEKALIAIVHHLAKNKRMSTAYGANDRDDWAEGQYNHVFYAAWGLAERAPVTPQWAHALATLFNSLERSASIKDPLTAAARWRPVDPREIALEEKSARETWHTEYQTVRKQVAGLRASTHLAELLASDDRAFRAAAYAYGQMNTEQIDSAVKRDGVFAARETLNNSWIWRTSEGRHTLETLSWIQQDEDNILSNHYRRNHERFSKTNPEWFRL